MTFGIINYTFLINRAIPSAQPSTSMGTIWQSGLCAATFLAVVKLVIITCLFKAIASKTVIGLPSYQEGWT